MRRAAIVAMIALATLQSAAACSSKKEDDGTTPLATKEELPALAIGEDTPNLLLTWIDEKGDMHVELKPADVPAEGRSLVRVVVSDREDGTKGLFYVVDLTKKRDDGTYAARTMTRRAWESEVEKRRSAYLAKIAPPPPAPTDAPSAAQGPKQTPEPPVVASDLTVIVYGADWCKPCHQAEDYLRSKGVRVVKKDVEASPEAALEMRDKLDKSGQRGGSIPVIDIRGQILVGFSTRAVDRALAKASSGTAL
ncbi:glutaredoxin domain-containing protein [Polyangium sp. 6x1]|uniref:glutaredoxin domain-containing protein n=1 Tax=Polyangium sp. 6x1 TaxID=3042689 RepID=UPI0024826277|nr:glutaredoxin domain-containing protein [Polyangium sp. 6x1]MDI1446245.1 glutaredoxin domain-containing protein [Polyangium sp. 6x1]